MCKEQNYITIILLIESICFVVYFKLMTFKKALNENLNFNCDKMKNTGWNWAQCLKNDKHKRELFGATL